MIHQTAAGLCLLVLTAFACSPQSQAPPDPPASEPGTPPADGNAAPDPGSAGPPDLATLEGTSWTLVELDGRTRGPGDAPITLAFAGGRVSGSGGCNQYFGTVTSASPGAMAIGEVGATKRACPDPTMGSEQRYFESLRRVSAWAAEGGNLVLSWRGDGAAAGRLVFEPREPGS